MNGSLAEQTDSPTSPAEESDPKLAEEDPSQDPCHEVVVQQLGSENATTTQPDVCPTEKPTLLQSEPSAEVRQA